MKQRTYFEQAAAITVECSSPVRLAILEYLLKNGPTRMHSLAESTNIAGSVLSSNLRRLREAEIIDVERQGESVTYSIANPSIRQIIANLSRAAGVDIATPIPEHQPAITFARSCYSHLAGSLGVQLTRAPFAKETLITGAGDITFGPNTEKCFVYLSTGLSSLDASRKTVFLCNGWTHADSHLAGSPGAALLCGLISKGWLTPVPDSRGLELTEEDEVDFEDFIGTRLEP